MLFFIYLNMWDQSSGPSVAYVMEWPPRKGKTGCYIDVETFINHWISTLNISCLYPEWHFFKWYCQLQFGIDVLFCKNKLLSNLTEIEWFPWRKGFWMAFGSDLFSKNKLSSNVVIQSPQTEKLKGIWLKIVRLELSCIVHFMTKTKMNYYRDFQLTGSAHGKWASDGCVSKEKLQLYCSHTQKHPFWFLLFVTHALSELPWLTVLSLSPRLPPDLNLPPFSHQDPNNTPILAYLGPLHEHIYRFCRKREGQKELGEGKKQLKAKPFNIPFLSVVFSMARLGFSG